MYRRLFGLEAFHDLEPLENDQRVVVDREIRADHPPQVVDVAIPEAFVGDPKLGGVAIALALVDGVLIVDVGEPGYPAGDCLDDRNRSLV